ncbi:MAG: PAS domain S-box protein [Bdellovibrionales bacterium]|nr:PAS domain S-box protein [Bdellovibrionales bacterium]
MFRSTLKDILLDIKSQKIFGFITVINVVSLVCLILSIYNNFSFRWVTSIGIIFGITVILILYKLINIITKIHSHKLALDTKINNLEKALAESTLVSQTDIYGTIIGVNERFCKISQYTSDELIGQSHNIVRSGEHSKEYYKEMWATIKEGKVWKGEFKNKKKDGSFYWVDATISPIFNSKHEIESYIAVRFDITDRKQAEEQLKRKQQSLVDVRNQLDQSLKQEKVVSDILEISSKPFSLKDKLLETLDIILKLSWLPIQPQGAIFLVDKTQSETLSLEAQINLAEPLTKLCHKVKFGHCLCGAAAKEKQIMFASCIDDRHHIRFDGIQPHGHYNIPLIFRGKLLGVMVIYLEHGHKKSRTEMDSLLLFSRAIAQMIEGALTLEALEKERSKLIQSSKMSTLGEMAGGISHELNNPLAIIKGYASIMKKQSQMNAHVDSILVKSMTEKIESGVNRMSLIIDGLRNFARDGEQDQFTQTNLLDLIQETLSFCKGRFAKSDVSLKLEIDPDVNIYCQPVQISQVLLNLLNNSLDALDGHSREAHPNVTIRGIEQDKCVNITVVDNGPGVKKEISEKIFEPFFTTKEIGKGTGLGLSISLGIIESHSGLLTYNRNNGQSEFNISLPSIAYARKNASL